MLLRQNGFSYLIAMFLVAAASIVAVRALEISLTAERREKEAELLVVGMAYRDAIKNYYENTPGTVKKLPTDLESLLLDQRTTVPRRPLRKLFRDPISGSTEWGLVKMDDGSIIGVYSLSALKPFKTGGFPAVLSGFANKAHYYEWQFVFEPT